MGACLDDADHDGSRPWVLPRAALRKPCSLICESKSISAIQMLRTWAAFSRRSRDQSSIRSPQAQEHSLRAPICLGNPTLLSGYEQPVLLHLHFLLPNRVVMPLSV